MPGTIAPFNVDNRWPFFGYNPLWNFSGNVTKIKGAHNMKTGLFVEHTTRPAQRSSSFNGSLSFNADGSNPLNTNFGFANGAARRGHAYQESDGHPSAHGQFMNTEFYAQDNWRVNAELHDRRRHPLLLHHADAERRRQRRRIRSGRLERRAGAAALPADDSVNGARAALNPLTGETLPPIYIGRLVPGTGNFINGMVRSSTARRRRPTRSRPRRASGSRGT